MSYTIDCTGDCVTGDAIRFERAVFTGSYRKPKFSHTEIVEGVIVAESYGKGKQQHTFTIEKTDGTRTRIKGRNLYRNGVMRKPWKNEQDRIAALQEKHNRGDAAREQRDARRMNESLY